MKGTKTLSATTLLLALSACLHAPLRPFDCKDVLSLRLGQSPDEVKALLGKPQVEESIESYWEKERVADYMMWFNDLSVSGRAWLPDWSDVFFVEFFKNRLVKASAFRSGEFLVSYEDSLGLALGSPSYGQPSPRNGNRPEPARAQIGPAFDKIFQCRSDAAREKHRADFEAQLKAR